MPGSEEQCRGRYQGPNSFLFLFKPLPFVTQRNKNYIFKELIAWMIIFLPLRQKRAGVAVFNRAVGLYEVYLEAPVTSRRMGLRGMLSGNWCCPGSCWRKGFFCPPSPARAASHPLARPLPGARSRAVPGSVWSPCLTQRRWVVRCVISGVFPRRTPARILPFPAQPDGICPPPWTLAPLSEG